MSMLNFFEENYELFKKFDGKLGSFIFPNDITDIITILMKKTNDNYNNNCNKLKVKPSDIFDYQINKDEFGNCYLEILGADKKTKIIIVKDGLATYKTYDKMIGKKIVESSFKDILDLYQKEKLKLAHISKRFLKDEFPPINLNEEFDLEALKKYYEYLDNIYNRTRQISVSFEAPINERMPHKEPTNKSKERVNDIIDYSVRKQALISHKPIYIISLSSTNGNIKYDAYIYSIDGYYMCVCEPINGTSYTMYLNLGPIENLNEDVLINNVRAVLESKENIILSDDAIIRKTHTNIDAYNRNLSTFFTGDKTNYRFYNDIESSKEVFGKK